MMHKDHLKYDCPSCGEKLIKFIKGPHFFCKHENMQFIRKDGKMVNKTTPAMEHPSRKTKKETIMDKWGKWL